MKSATFLAVGTSEIGRTLTFRLASGGRYPSKISLLVETNSLLLITGNLLLTPAERDVFFSVAKLGGSDSLSIRNQLELSIE